MSIMFLPMMGGCGGGSSINDDKSGVIKALSAFWFVCVGVFLQLIYIKLWNDNSACAYATHTVDEITWLFYLWDYVYFAIIVGVLCILGIITLSFYINIGDIVLFLPSLISDVSENIDNEVLAIGICFFILLSGCFVFSCILSIFQMQIITGALAAISLFCGVAFKVIGTQVDNNAQTEGKDDDCWN